MLVLVWDKLIVGRVPFIPLPLDVVAEIASSMRLRPGDVVYDLGCGDGSVLLAMHAVEPKARYIGIEKAIIPYIMAKIKTRNIAKITIVRGDIRTRDYARATMVFAYLLPVLLGPVVAKVIAEAKNLRTIVSVEYQPEEVARQVRFEHVPLKTQARLVSKYYIWRR